MFKVNNKDSRTTPFVNFDHISPCSSVSIVNFEHVIAGWEGHYEGLFLQSSCVDL